MPDVEKKLKELADFIRDKNDTIVTGDQEQIKEMEKRVLEFCKFASDQPFEETENFRTDIEFLAEYLGKLASHLNLRHEDIARELSELGKRRKAAVAYKYIGGKKD